MGGMSVAYLHVTGLDTCCSTTSECPKVSLRTDNSLHHNDSILDEESVRQSSKFAAYVGGGVPLRHDSRASAMSKGSKPTSARAFANSVRKERKDGKIQLGVGLPGQ